MPNQINQSDKKLLVTGGAGCLGSNIIEHYVDKGYTICVIDNFETGNFINQSSLNPVKLIEGCISSHLLVEKIISEFDPRYIFHCAASYNDPNNWIKDTKTNIIGAINVVNAAKKLNNCKIINFQTALCYGRTNVSPIPVSHPLAPFSSYGISKTAAERYMLEASIPVISLRIGNVCAPRLSIGPLPTFYSRLLEEKECYFTDAIRDYLDISDFLNLLDLILESDVSKGVFNVSSGVGNSIKELFECVVDSIGIKPCKVTKLNIGQDDIKEVVLCPKTTEQTFGWQSKVEFKQMIKRQCEWFEKDGVEKIFSHLKKPNE